eukprot:5874496-Amphidinium_carterae.1
MIKTRFLAQFMLAERTLDRFLVLLQTCLRILGVQKAWQVDDKLRGKLTRWFSGLVQSDLPRACMQRGLTGVLDSRADFISSQLPTEHPKTQYPEKRKFWTLFELFGNFEGLTTLSPNSQDELAFD